jgi:hypothetical protein
MTIQNKNDQKATKIFLKQDISSVTGTEQEAILFSSGGK